MRKRSCRVARTFLQLRNYPCSLARAFPKRGTIRAALHGRFRNCGTTRAALLGRLRKFEKKGADSFTKTFYSPRCIQSRRRRVCPQ